MEKSQIINSFGDKVLVLYDEDLNESLIKEMEESARPVAIDTEASGLNLQRDYLCLVQIAFNDKYYLLKVVQDRSRSRNRVKYKNFCKLLANKKIKKIFHFGRFDIAMMYTYFNVLCENIFCTKIASRLVRTYTDRHGLQALIKDVLKRQISKDRDQQCGDWKATLTEAQIEYAVNDVRYLEDLYVELDKRLIREKRAKLAHSVFKALLARVMLDVSGWESVDIFAHL